jgi:hypothetical protein
MTVTLPNGDTIQSAHTALLNMPHLLNTARLCHIFPKLKNKVLLSIGQFCVHGFTATFTADTLHIYKGATSYMQGKRKRTNGLWYIDLENQHKQAVPSSLTTSTTPKEANNLYTIGNQKLIILFFHRACFSPVPSTWIAAIDAGFFITWPRLTSKLVIKLTMVVL